MKRMRERFAALSQRIGQWPGPVKAGVLIVGVVVAAVALHQTYRSYDYVMNNPEFCRSCHTMGDAWDRWRTSEHRTVNCHECHPANAFESARQVVTFVIRRPQRVGRHAVVPHEVCGKCHESGDPQWRQVANTAGHQVHVGQRNIQCVACHAPSIHRFRPVVAVCGTCHVAQTSGERVVKIRAMADQHCTECHRFLRAESPLRPVRESCLDCHRAIPNQVGLWPAGAPMQFACGTCHRPHEQARPVVTCTQCHDRPRPDMHPAATLATTPCTTCHIPHKWRFGQ